MAHYAFMTGYEVHCSFCEEQHSEMVAYFPPNPPLRPTLPFTWKKLLDGRVACFRHEVKEYHEIQVDGNIVKQEWT